VALAGSGEFLPVMEPVDRALLEGRPPRAAFLPTAAALEGDERVAYWLDLGTRHFAAMGVEPVPVPVRTRDDAHDPALAERIADVGVVYLSGGNPHYLADTLRDTPVWAAIDKTWRAGAALAGCSAGAMALTAGAPSLGDHGAAAGVANGLGAVEGLVVIPHFDRMEQWRPGVVDRYRAWLPPGTLLVGVDEDTALVGDGSSWRVEGRQRAWMIDADGGRRPLQGTVDLPGVGWGP